MNRSNRTLIVLLVAVGLASGATYLVYKALKNRPAAQAELTTTTTVVAAHPLPLGARIAASDVKLIAWPVASVVPGSFTKIEDVVDRGVIVAVGENEPLTPTKIAGKDAGAGLPPTIPTGMRAISVRVNEVIGVAGFVLPNTRVDVMVILRQQANSMARVVVSNVTVLAAGTQYGQEAAKEGQPMAASVVTLLVNPEDAEKIGLASTEGQILLTLRNPLDTAPTTSAGIRTANLAGGDFVAAPANTNTAPPPSSAKVRKAVAPAPAPAPPPPPKVYSVEVIRGGKRSEEIIK